MIPAGKMVVDYSATGHVCRIQLPPRAPVQHGSVQSAKAMDDFILELVPLARRGKELVPFGEAMGLPSISGIEYEYVTISESFQGQQRTGVTVMLKNETCRNQPVNR